MSESRTRVSSIQRILIPLLIAVVLVVATVLVSGSNLIRVEDITVNRILAGTYGEPDWRVQEMNPLLSQLLSFLYRLLPAVNWYGVALLALMACAAAMAISLAARKSGGLIPAAIVIAPILIILSNSVTSTTACALCAAAGAYALLDGVQRHKEGIAGAVGGAVLFAFALLLSFQWAVVLGLCTLACWLLYSVSNGGFRGLLIGAAVMVICAGALYGYSALMYGTPELSAYRTNYAQYERLLHSNLRTERSILLEEYGDVVDAADHDHGDDVTEEEAHVDEEEVVVRPNIFDTVGWTVNDADMFFTRYNADSKLVDPQVVQTLSEADGVSYWNTSPSDLWQGLLETLRKPQFAMLAALLVVCAVAVAITSPRNLLVAILAVILGFGGHLLALARYYDAFADIGPFYLAAIVTLLVAFDGTAAAGWYRRFFKPNWLRLGIGALVAVVFVVGLGGILYYTRVTPVNVNRYTLEAVEFLRAYINEHPDMLFIGDNPNERTRPDTLAAPKRGEDKTLLAGSYDLYSPRATAMMEAYGIDNPLPDSIGRDDIGYVIMGFPEPVTYRMISEYDTYLKTPVELLSYPEYSEMIVELTAFTDEEVATIVREYEEEGIAIEALLQAMQILDDEGYFDDLETEGDADLHDPEVALDGADSQAADPEGTEPEGTQPDGTEPEAAEGTDTPPAGGDD